MENIIKIIESNFVNIYPYSKVIDKVDNFNTNDPETLKKMMWASYFLFFQDKKEEARTILQELISVDFDGDYDKWTWIEGGILLMIEISNEQKKDLVEKVLNTLSYGNDEQKNNLKKKTFQRRLLGQLLNKGKILSAQDNNDPVLELLYLIPYFKELLFIEHLGNNEKLNIEEIEEEKKFSKNCFKRITDSV